MIETVTAVIGNLWVVEPFRWLVYLIAATSFMAWVAGHVQRVSEEKDPPAWISVVEYPVYFITTVLSVMLNLVIGWIWGPPKKDTLTLTKRLEEVLANRSEYKTWQVKVAEWIAWWVNTLWMGHIKNV